MRSVTFSNACDSQILTKEGEAPGLLANNPTLLPLQRRLDGKMFWYFNFSTFPPRLCFFFFAGEVKCSVLLEPMSLMS